MHIDGNEVVTIMAEKVASLTVENANLKVAFNKVNQERSDLVSRIADLESQLAKGEDENVGNE